MGNAMRDPRTYSIIGAALEVHRELGAGFLEAVYQEALQREFELRAIPHKAQPIMKIMYKKEPLRKTYQPDFVCYNAVVVEIKAIAAITGNEEAQIINYLKASERDIGLLLNFGSPSLQHKRFIYSP